MKANLHSWAVALVAVVVSTASLAASAAEVRTGISSRETYVGLPVTFQVQVSNARQFDPPKAPEVPGLRIESAGTPARSTQTTIVNGNVSTRSSVTYSFVVTPTRAGEFRIPALAVQADGETIETRPIDFVASKSETGDLLFVEIAGKHQEIYVGQALDLTLKIWVRPYRDADRGVTLSEGDMWRLVAERTNWGPFAARLADMAAQRERPIGEEVLRKDSEGASHRYYLYEVDATIYPKKPGRIDAGEVEVVALYPTAIGESRDPFGGMMEEMGFFGGGGMNDRFFSPFAPRLAIESVRPIVAEAVVEPIEVREIPTAGRPADYRGAVGDYRIISHVEPPAEVKAGDAITLLLGIAGTGPMDLVQAPPLADLPELVKDFKVPHEPLAGYVDGDRKVFTTTIRPRHEGVTEIPAIPLTFFDPATGEFVTTRSQPIPIKVTPADMLVLDDAVVTNNASSKAGTGKAGAASPVGPQLTNLSGSDLLVSQSSPVALGRWFWWAVAAPPVVVVGLAVASGRRFCAFAANALQSASRRFASKIDAAASGVDVGAALRQALQQDLRLPASADDASLTGALRSRGHRSVAVRCERLLQQCESQHGWGIAHGPTLADLKQAAAEIVEELQSQRRSARPAIARPSRRWRPTVVAIMALELFCLASPGARAATIDDDAATRLTPSQQETILAEATARYDAALQTAATDSADAKAAFAEAAAKYQLLVDAGIQNAGLYFNLGNAYLEAGAKGRAIANYRRALALEPTHRPARINLQLAEGAVSAEKSESTRNAPSLTDQAAFANERLNWFVSPRAVLALGVAGWIAFWAAIGLRLSHIRFAWKTTAVAVLALVLLAAASFALSCRTLGHASAIVVADQTLRTGDGDRFPTVDGATLAEGQTVSYLRRRGHWVQVELPDGQTGWLPRTGVEAL
jgi:tetratricopeptide (TPR) repeat protein